ncbi:hypothetical protein FRC06_001375, partial [Ceratobasidium sp. 370]
MESLMLQDLLAWCLTPYGIILIIIILAAAGLYIKSPTHEVSPPTIPGHWLFKNQELLKAPWRGILLAEKYKPQYGDIIQLSTPFKKFVVLNSWQVISEVLDKQSAVTSDRPQNVMLFEMCEFGQTVVFRNHDETHRKHRRVMASALHPAAARSYAELHSTTSAFFLRDLVNRISLRSLTSHSGTKPNHSAPMAAAIHDAIGRFIMRMIYGHVAVEDDPLLNIARHQAEFILTGFSRHYWVNDFPILRYIPTWFPGAEFAREAQYRRELRIRAANEPFVPVLKDIKQGSVERLSYSSKLLELKGGANVSEEDVDLVKWTAQPMFGAGSTTTTALIKSFIFAMCIYPDIAARVRAEIDIKVGRDRLPNLHDREVLPYTAAVLQEVIRFFPVFPLGLQHCASEDLMIRGYTIKRGTVIEANIWALMREPATYPNPNTFDPDRFLKQTPDPDPRRIIFGFGRRVCPGQHVANNGAFTMCAAFMSVFDVTTGYDTVCEVERCGREVWRMFTPYGPLSTMVSTRRNPSASSERAAAREGGGMPEDKHDPGQEYDESIDGNTSSEHDDVLVPGKKRARSGRAPARAGRKKYVRGKQGGLKGLMKMPVEIFTEIAYLLNPGDLISLARSNKFFRKMLLKRSAAQIWQRAESNMPGLPPCLAGMCEPEYAALVFSKYCTLCGASATSKPDLDLRARLCTSCRDTEVEVLSQRRGRPEVDLTLVHYSFRTRPKKNKSQPRTPMDAAFIMKSELDKILEKQEEFHRTGDQEGLAQWEKERRAEVLARRMHAHRVSDYLMEAEASRGQDLDSMKRQRRKTILERLKALGWADEDLDFEGPELKPWRALVNAPKPLTDRVWANILPKLTQMLEENRERHIASAKRSRQIERRARVDKFLLNMRYSEHPFEPIFKALGVPTPPPPDLDGPGDMLRRFKLSIVRPETPNPFPKPQTALKWDCLGDLDEPEISIEEVENILAERKTQIQEKVLEWRTLVEQRLVEKFESHGKQVNEDVVLKVAGSSDSTIHLPRNTRLLLRADTLFHREGPNTNDTHFAFYTGISPFYYPYFVSSSYDILEDSENSTHPDKGQETDLVRYTRDTETESIVKSLLHELGMQDASHIELGVFKSRFA